MECLSFYAHHTVAQRPTHCTCTNLNIGACLVGAGSLGLTSMWTRLNKHRKPQMNTDALMASSLPGDTMAMCTPFFGDKQAWPLDRAKKVTSEARHLQLVHTTKMRPGQSGNNTSEQIRSLCTNDAPLLAVTPRV